jgi:hypothetical protein
VGGDCRHAIGDKKGKAVEAGWERKKGRKSLRSDFFKFYCGLKEQFIYKMSNFSMIHLAFMKNSVSSHLVVIDCMQDFCILNNGKTSESSRLISERYEVLTDVTTKVAFQDVLPYSW